MRFHRKLIHSSDQIGCTKPTNILKTLNRFESALFVNHFLFSFFGSFQIRGLVIGFVWFLVGRHQIVETERRVQPVDVEQLNLVRLSESTARK